jgi:hypothetical protein
VIRRPPFGILYKIEFHHPEFHSSRPNSART